MITTREKQNIAVKLQEYVEQKGSQNKAANSLNGVSSATVSQIRNNKWDLINDEMWRNIASQIGYSKESWVIVETQNFKKMTHVFSDAKQNSLVFGVIGETSCGKTQPAKTYSKHNENAYHLKCDDFWTRRFFLSQLIKEMGIYSTSLSIPDMMYDIITEVQKKDNPLIIIDEADKLSDQLLLFFITLYNNLEDKCGIIIMATPYLRDRIVKGAKKNKKGFREVYSRIGKKFIELKDIGSVDVSSICQANGIEDKSIIKDIWNNCEGDLRRVKRLIHAAKLSTRN